MRFDRSQLIEVGRTGFQPGIMPGVMEGPVRPWHKSDGHLHPEEIFSLASVTGSGPDNINIPGIHSIAELVQVELSGNRAFRQHLRYGLNAPDLVGVALDIHSHLRAINESVDNINTGQSTEAVFPVTLVERDSIPSVDLEEAFLQITSGEAGSRKLWYETPEDALLRAVKLKLLGVPLDTLNLAAKVDCVSRVFLEEGQKSTSYLTASRFYNGISLVRKVLLDSAAEVMEIDESLYVSPVGGKIVGRKV